jgi:hypothetical protein
MLIAFLTEIMVFAAVGALLDSVFISAQEREQISKYLESGTKDITVTQRFSKFLNRAHSIIFGRFFTGKLFSRSFVASAAVVSVVSFSLVLGTQFYLFPEQFSQLSWNNIQIWIFIAFIGFNILFDYVTIIQTKVFIEASLTSPSIFRALVFIGADLIVTMNTFILSYAIFIIIVVQFFVGSPEQVTIVLDESQPSYERNLASELSFLGDLQDSTFIDELAYKGSVRSVLFAQGNPEGAKRSVIYYYSNFDSSTPTTDAYILSALSNIPVSGLTLTVVKDGDTYQEYRNALGSVTPELSFRDESDDADNIPELDTSELLVMDFSANPSVVRNGSINAAYTSSFVLTDNLEDGFPASITQSSELPRLSELIEATVASPINDGPRAICFRDGIPTIRFQITSRTVNYFEDCTEFIVVALYWANRLDKDLALVGRHTQGYRVPFNTLLITSILPTAFFYVSIILLAISTLIFSKAISGTNRIKKFFLRAPLAIAGALLGLFLSLLGLV